MAVGFFPFISLKIFPLPEFLLSSFSPRTTAGLPLPSSLFSLVSTLPQCQRLAGHVLMRWAGAQVLFHSPAHADVTNGWQHTPSWSLTILLSPGLPATANQSEWHQGTNHLSPGQDVPIMGPCLWFPAHVAGQCFY